MDEKKIVEVKIEEGREIYALEGYGIGSPAILVEWGYSMSGELGLHGCTGSFAEAQLGTLDEEMEFVSDLYTAENTPNRACIGRPKEIEGWDPEEDGEDDDEDNEVDWDAYAAWVEDYCRRTLSIDSK